MKVPLSREERRLIKHQISYGRKAKGTGKTNIRLGRLQIPAVRKIIVRKIKEKENRGTEYCRGESGGGTKRLVNRKNLSQMALMRLKAALGGAGGDWQTGGPEQNFSVPQKDSDQEKTSHLAWISQTKRKLVGFGGERQRIQFTKSRQNKVGVPVAEGVRKILTANPGL